MSNNHRATARTRRIAGAFVGVALSAAAVLASSMPATAAGSDGRQPYGHTPSSIPSTAVRADHGPETAGWHGPAFQTGSRTRIVGGTEADISDFPGVVGIRTYYWWWNGSTYDYVVSTCTGTVISPTKILTAGHCAIDPERTDAATDVIAGRSNLKATTGGYIAKVANVWTHQAFNASQLNTVYGATPTDDVAVLTLKAALPSEYTPVTLAPQGDTTALAGTQAAIVGYGVTGTNNADSGILREAKVPFRTDAECSAIATADGATYDSGRMICAGTRPDEEGGPVDSCYGDSGGPIFTAGNVQAGITDWGPLDGCATSYGFYERLSYYNSAIMADVNRANMPVNLDFSGDGHSDLMFRVNKTGKLGQISGTGFMVNSPAGALGGINDISLYGSTEWNKYNWNAYKKLFRVTNWHGDGTESIFAMKSDGRLYEYRTNGAGVQNGSPAQIGTGWTMFVDIVVTNNWLGDGRPNLMGRTADGRLVIYTSNGRGGWTNSHGTQIGTGWNMFNTVLTPGNWRGQGQSLIGRTTKGDLRLYESNGRGGWKNGKGTLIGTGWNSLPTFLSPGDWNGDNLIDLIGISSTGAFKLYPTNGQGKWLASKGWTMTGGAWGPLAGVTVF